MLTAYALFISIFTVLLSSYFYLTNIYSYWKKRNIIGPKPSFPFGNVFQLAKRSKSLRDLITEFYFDYPNEKFVGIFQGRQPKIIVKDPADIKNVLIKDFSYFRNRNLLIDKSPIGDNLFHANDDTWRLLRQKLTPIFTSGKTKAMFPLMQQCVEQFHNYLSNLVSNEKDEEVRQIAVKFTLQFFSSCVLGISVNTLTDENNEFHQIARKATSPRWIVTVSQIVDSIFPGLIRKLNIPLSNSETVDFFKKLVKNTLEERSAKQRVRKDFMDLLMDLKEQGHITGEGVVKNIYSDYEFTEMTMVAQTLIFYVAGFETSSSAISFTLFELAMNQDIQEKAYEEIKRVTGNYVTGKCNGLLTYEGIQEMKYLEMVVSEGLRKYPSAGFLVREAASDYTFPETQITIEKGIKVLIPVYSLHRDPKYFPNPETFDPERFSPENKINLKQLTYLPFGEGPRNCIAARFARTQTMVGLAGVLQKFRVVPSKMTKTKINFNPTAISLQSANGIHLKILPRLS